MVEVEPEISCGKRRHDSWSSAHSRLRSVLVLMSGLLMSCLFVLAPRLARAHELGSSSLDSALSVGADLSDDGLARNGLAQSDLARSDLARSDLPAEKTTGPADLPAESNLLAGMCSERAESLKAPPIIYPSATAIATGCTPPELSLTPSRGAVPSEASTLLPVAPQTLAVLTPPLPTPRRSETLFSPELPEATAGQLIRRRLPRPPRRF